MNGGGRGGVWIVMFSEVTLFVYSVSTILLLIVATKPTVTKAWPLLSPNDNTLRLITTVALTLMLVKGNLAFSGFPVLFFQNQVHMFMDLFQTDPAAEVDRQWYSYFLFC